MSETPPLLRLHELTIGFQTSFGELRVTDQVSFDIRRGERVGLVGESGCGKTVTGLAIMRLLPGAVGRVRGRIDFEGRDLTRLP